MDNIEFDRSKPVVDMAQRFYPFVNVKSTNCGVDPLDALIASTCEAHKLATDIHGSAVADAVWMREALDQIERDALEQRPHGS